MTKLTVLLIYGGRSYEHEVSIASAKYISANIDKNKYDLIPIKIGLDGVWRLDEQFLIDIQSDNIRLLCPQPGVNRLMKTDGSLAERFDVVFSVIHGNTGEDGSLQGLFELAELSYVGSGVLGSALGMDKAIQKSILANAGISVVKHVVFNESDWQKNKQNVIKTIEDTLSFPIFVKPANLGSSIGITKVKAINAIGRAIDQALIFSKKIIVEQAVPNVREIEVAVLINNDEIKISQFGEIEYNSNFYDFETKYNTDNAMMIIPADLPDKLVKQCEVTTKNVCGLLECFGLVRVDFLLDDKSGKIYLNEINTVPGFTKSSMFPLLWEKSGLNGVEVINFLLKSAEQRSKKIFNDENLPRKK